MRIYNFTSFPHAISNLKNKRLKISRFNELNDPFELLAADLLDIRHREAFTRFKKQLNEKAGIVCFSGAWGNPLIWGHYAKRHTGIALGFDVSDEMLLKVHYTASRPKIEFDQTKRKVVDGSKVVDQLIRTKFIDWKYEDEYRMVSVLRTHVAFCWICVIAKWVSSDVAIILRSGCSFGSATWLEHL
ncbi:DUF2971 domain-containing protein [Polynucleobacter kasalickyi]|uniref:DUF2971 domain-containing protein n=1 Tax=Polynucleobacter kasalickyi TaxID=1938817 RepID=A0A1W2CF15_9BURK|nr:Protein of unknown function [Polynucleobacter kasalickyi]